MYYKNFNFETSEIDKSLDLSIFKSDLIPDSEKVFSTFVLHDYDNMICALIVNYVYVVMFKSDTAFYRAENQMREYRDKLYLKLFN